MKLKLLFTITAVLSWINGILFIFFPRLSVTLLGGQLGAAGMINALYHGVFAFGWGILLWVARTFKNEEDQRAVAFSIGATLILSSLAGLYGFFSHTYNAFIWSFISIDAILAVLFLKMAFKHGARLP